MMMKMEIKAKYSKKLKSRCAAVCAALLMLSTLSGCGESDMDALVLARDVSYTGVKMDTAEIEKGNLSPTFEHLIELEGYEETNYRVEKDIAEELETIYEAKLDKVCVSVGDRVKAGDTLITFKSESLSKQLREYADSKEKAVIKKDHLLRLMDIDSSLDFTDDIKELDIEIQKANNHINDINATYNKINITAEKDGVVKSIDQSVQDGFLVVGRNMITVSDDAGYYVMDLSDDLDTSTSGDAKLLSSDVRFHVGDRCKAKTFMSEYEGEGIEDPTKSSTETDAVASGTDAMSGGKVYFKLTGDATLKENILTVVVEMPEIKDALYVDRKGVIFTDKEDYVYKEVDGEFIATKVIVGDSVGQLVIIKEGLEEGDVVSLSE